MISNTLLRLDEFLSSHAHLPEELPGSAQVRRHPLSRPSRVASNIGGYENGRSLMSIATLVRIAEALHVEPGELLKGVTSEMFPVMASDRRRVG